MIRILTNILIKNTDCHPKNVACLLFAPYHHYFRHHTAYLATHVWVTFKWVIYILSVNTLATFGTCITKIRLLAHNVSHHCSANTAACQKTAMPPQYWHMRLTLITSQTEEKSMFTKQKKFKKITCYTMLLDCFWICIFAALSRLSVGTSRMAHSVIRRVFSFHLKHVHWDTFWVETNIRMNLEYDIPTYCKHWSWTDTIILYRVLYLPVSQRRMRHYWVERTFSTGNLYLRR